MLRSTPQTEAPRHYAHGPTLYRLGLNRYVSTPGPFST